MFKEHHICSQCRQASLLHHFETFRCDRWNIVTLKLVGFTLQPVRCEEVISVADIYQQRNQLLIVCILLFRTCQPVTCLQPLIYYKRWCWRESWKYWRGRRVTEVNHILKAVCEVVKVDEGSNRRGRWWRLRWGEKEWKWEGIQGRR